MASVLFPSQSRTFVGQRWVSILLRTLHLLGIAGVGGGYFYASVGDGWLGFLYLTLASGLLMMSLSIWSNGIWLLQLRGHAVLLKVLLLTLMLVWAEQKTVLLVVVIIISGLIAHAPGDVRYYSIFYRRRIDKL
ncbi:MAG: hypothetical protein L3J26_00880 [Candidatus Polarisedimenticolaceae bacterium]|nr:hypothetical protein [Candidatus Polarisedimenticolaceae bacterium]